MGKVGTLLLMLALWPISLAAQTTQPGPSPISQAIKDLTGQNFDLMARAARAKSWEVTRSDADAAMNLATAKITAHLQAAGSGRELLETDGRGPPLWALPALLGFPDILEIFLRYPEVRAQLDQPLTIGGKQARIWSIVNAAPIQSGTWCGGQYELMVFFYPSSAPYLEAHLDQTPYLKVRELLEQAGATRQPEEARAVWRFLCRIQTRPDQSELSGGYWKDDDGNTFLPEIVPGSRERVLAAPDMLAAIQRELLTLKQLRADGKAPVTP